MKLNEKNVMIGKFFHSIEDSKVKWQGYIKGKPEEGFYLVALFSWGDGQEIEKKIVEINEMKSWFFYDSPEEMKKAMKYGEASRYQ
jgi:hypothetical protein